LPEREVQKTGLQETVKKANSRRTTFKQRFNVRGEESTGRGTENCGRNALKGASVGEGRNLPGGKSPTEEKRRSGHPPLPRLRMGGYSSRNAGWL